VIVEKPECLEEYLLEESLEEYFELLEAKESATMSMPIDMKRVNLDSYVINAETEQVTFGRTAISGEDGPYTVTFDELDPTASVAVSGYDWADEITFRQWGKLQRGIGFNEGRAFHEQEVSGNDQLQLSAESKALEVILDSIAEAKDPFKTSGDWIAKFTNAALKRAAETEDES
jgi:hypothetical protein